MEKLKKDLLAIYLNEFNFNFLHKGATKYNCFKTLEYLNLSKKETYTKDKIQNYNLDPWVQSVSINTGKESRQHKVYKLGQPVKNVTQIWDILSNKKISSAVWGAMNSKLKQNKYLKYYFPDPWNYKDKSKPFKLMSLYLLPNYYAKNYLSYSKLKFLNYAFIFLIGLIKNSKFFDLVSDIIFSIKVFFKKGLKNYILFFLFDIFFLNVVFYSIKKQKTDFTIIFLNSIAHYQHNNWNEKNNEEVFFNCVERIFSKIDKIKNDYESIILFNGFTQKKISTEYLLRPKNPQKFLSYFIKFKSLEQDMTNGGFIFFKNKKEMKEGYKILNQLYFNKTRVLELKKYSDKIIFYKINIKSKKILRLHDKNIQIQEIQKLRVTNKKKRNIKNFFIKNVEFIKTTGTHIPNGIILYKFIKSLKQPKKIMNHHIFFHICKHFNINLKKLA